MPSQEDYLDSLLKDLAIEQENRTAEEEPMPAEEEPMPAGEEPMLTEEEPMLAEEESAFAEEEPVYAEAEPVAAEEAPMLEDVDGMSEEEIIRLLSMSNDSDENSAEAKAEPGDVLELLSDTNDADLQAIQELLEKSDNNETIEGFAADSPEESAPEPVETQDGIVMDKQQRRKEQKAAKKAERAAAKEARAAAKAAAKEARVAAIAAAKETKAAKRALKKAKSVGSIEKEDGTAGKSEENSVFDAAEGEEEPFDVSLLDSIVSEADRAGMQGYEAASAQKPEVQPDGTKNAGGETDAVDSEADIMQNAVYGAVDDFDLNSLFAGGGEENLGQAVDETEFPDSMALDADETDDMLQNIAGQNSKEKKGFFTKLVELFTEEDEEEPENENIQLSEENKEILKDLDKERGAGKKKKKSKKKGKEAENEENGAEKPVKKKKPRKEKKPKQEKEQEEYNAPSASEKRLSPKKVIPIMLIALSLGVLLIVFANSAANYADKKTAHAAYYEGDYQTCFQNLYGKDLNESEQIMYAKSESILYIRLWLSEYEMFAEEGSELEALDSLIQTVDQYPVLYEYAVQWNAGNEVAAGYAEILSILSGKYGLTEEQAQAIADEPDDVEYTRMVLAMIQGKQFGSWNEPEIPVVPDSSSLEDALPEEEELGKEIFINNQ